MVRVSVILPAWNSQDTIVRCLESLRAQTFREFEVIVVDSSPTGQTAALVSGRFPEVNVEHSATRLTPHAARNAGASRAAGDILVFSDPDCIMAPAWLERITAAIDEGRPVVGGAVSSANTDWFSTGVHYCKYGWWLPGGPPGVRPELPSANVSYTKAVFERIGPFPEPWCGDTILSQRAAAAGVEPWFAPEACLLHDQRTTWSRFLRERMERGYDYGTMRPRLERWSRLRTLGYLLAAPLIVIAMMIRALAYASSAGQLARLAWCSPVVLLGYAAREWGEMNAHWRIAWRRS